MSYTHPNVVRGLADAMNGTTHYGKRATFSSAMLGRMSTDTSIHAATRSAKLATIRAKKHKERAKQLEEAFKEEQKKAEQLAKKLELRKQRILKRQLKQQKMIAAANKIQIFFVIQTKRYKNMRARNEATIKIQAQYRTNLLRREMIKKQKAATLITQNERMRQMQKRYRDHLAKKAHELQLQKELERQQFLKAEQRRRVLSAQKIQHVFRQKKRRDNALKIQVIWRKKHRRHSKRVVLTVDTSTVRHRVGPQRVPRKKKMSPTNIFLTQVADLDEREMRRTPNSTQNIAVIHSSHNRTMGQLHSSNQRSALVVSPLNSPRKSVSDIESTVPNQADGTTENQQENEAGHAGKTRSKIKQVQLFQSQGPDTRSPKQLKTAPSLQHNMHLKSVQKTMQVSNMQKWLPAFRRLESKFADANMTDAEKQDALKAMAIKEIKRAKWKQMTAAKEAKLLRIQKHRHAQQKIEKEAQEAQIRAKEQARLQWRKEAHAKDVRIAKAREKARKKKAAEEDRQRQQETEKKAKRVAQIRAVLQRSEVRKKKRELEEHKARARAAAEAEMKAEDKQKREIELKRLACERRKQKIRNMKHKEQEAAAAMKQAEEREAVRKIALKESQVAYQNRLTRERALRTKQKEQAQQAAADAQYEAEINKEDKKKKLAAFRAAAKERIRKNVALKKIKKQRILNGKTPLTPSRQKINKRKKKITRATMKNSSDFILAPLSTSRSANDSVKHRNLLPGRTTSRSEGGNEDDYSMDYSVDYSNADLVVPPLDLNEVACNTNSDSKSDIDFVTDDEIPVRKISLAEAQAVLRTQQNLEQTKKEQNLEQTKKEQNQFQTGMTKHQRTNLGRKKLVKKTKRRKKKKIAKTGKQDRTLDSMINQHYRRQKETWRQQQQQQHNKPSVRKSRADRWLRSNVSGGVMNNDTPKGDNVDMFSNSVSSIPIQSPFTLKAPGRKKISLKSTPQKRQKRLVGIQTSSEKSCSKDVFSSAKNELMVKHGPNKTTEVSNKDSADGDTSQVKENALVAMMYFGDDDDDDTSEDEESSDEEQNTIEIDDDIDDDIEDELELVQESEGENEIDQRNGNKIDMTKSEAENVDTVRGDDDDEYGSDTFDDTYGSGDFED